MLKKLLQFFTARLWLGFFCLGLGGTAVIQLLFPQNREAFSPGAYLFCIAIFVFILLGISLFPNKFKARYLLLLTIFIFHLGYLSPRLNYFAQSGQINNYYLYENMLLNPLVFFSVCFAFRLGGGESELCFKTGLSAVILLFSGFVDLMWFTVNQVAYTTQNVSIPHIRVIIGHEPSLGELYAFMAAHILCIIIINILPLKKWWYKYMLKENSKKETLWN